MSIQKTLLFTLCLFFLSTGFAHAALETADDSYGIPVSRFLQVEDPGVLDNDTVLDGQPASENGVTATLHTDVTKGTLSCQGVGPSLICPNGSFEYTPGPEFDGFDSFQYQAVSASTSETSPATTVTISACSGGPTVYICWHEASYLAKLSELGNNNTFVESFEGVAWDDARSPSSTAPSILSKGITWTTNHQGITEITTGDRARTGMWGVYDYNHGSGTGSTFECAGDNPPAHCFMHDGFSGRSPDVLYGVGGYISGKTGANVDIILDGTPHNGGRVSSGHRFMGVINTAGFNAFEYRELEGTIEQLLFIFGDDFTIATSATVPINNAPVLATIGDQATDENIQLSIMLNARDDDDGDVMSFSMSGGPAGATLSDNRDGTANFYWTPDYSQAGSYPVTFTVNDNGIPSASDSETITITVNDVVPPSGSLQFSAATYMVAENGTSATITVTRTDGSFGTVGVSYASSDGSATAGSDYTITSGTLSLADGVVSDSFTVAILDDTIYEGNESLNLTLSNPTGGASLGAQSSAVLTIAENDPLPPSGSLQFDMAGYTVAEDGVTATINVTRIGGDFGAASVDYTITDGTANTGSDYTAANGTINFADGDAVTKSFSISIINSPGTYEGDETVNLALSNATGATLGSPSSAVLTITENDPVPVEGSVQFELASYTVAEDGVMATVSVTRTGASGDFGAASVNYATSDGTATLADGDYTATNGTINFAAGDTASKIFTIPIANNVGVYESDETVNLSLSGATGASLGTPSSAILTITENDPVPSEGTLQFEMASYTVAEDGVTATITVTRSGGSFGAASVDYASSDGTATLADGDYTASSGTINFADGDDVAKTFSVPVANNAGTYEGDETVNLALSNITGATLGTPTSAVLTITENDPIPPSGTLQFGAPTYSVAEDGVSATITVTRSGGSFGAASVDYASSDGTATLADSDYTASSGTINFADGDDVAKTFSVPVANNAGTYEGDETVNLALSNVTGASLGAPSSAVLTITENDLVPVEGSVQFEMASHTVAEDGVMATVTVTRTGASGDFGAASVNYATSDGTATLADGDYTATNGTIYFAAGDTASKIFTIPIANNVGVYEGDETVNLSLSGATGASLGTPSSAILTITENDPIPPSGTLQFGAPTYSVAEDGVSATITVTRSGGSFGAASVDYASSDGTATLADGDYTAANGTINFADGDDVAKTFSVPVANNAGTYEGDETVNLALSNVTGASLGTPSSAILTITEKDPVPPAGTLQFSAPTYTVAEDGVSATIIVTRINGSFGTVGVDYVCTDGSATDGSDYTAVSGSLSFADGELTNSFTVPIFDDFDYEGDESVNLSLSFPTGGASLGSPSTAVLTITEDDPVPPAGSLQFSTPTYTEAENGTTATITVTRINGSFGTVGVDYVSSDGTATAGSDYTAVSGSLSFDDGVTSQTFTIDIFDDADYEGDETVNLTLSNPSGGAGLDSPSTAVLIITEDDPVPPAGSLQFSAVSYSVAEDGVSATITVSRVGGSYGTVGVDYASNDGTATAGADYTAVIGSLSFADGVTSQTFTINILDDTDYEGNETVGLILSNPSGGAGLGSPSSAILTITEDDPVPPAGSLQFDTASYTVAEDGVMATINVTRTGGSFGDVGVDYASSDGTATAGSDYTAVSGSLSFADGVTSQTFTITILDDAKYEGNETLYLSLSNPVGGAGLGSPAITVLTITEDDPVPPSGSLQFSDTDYQVNEKRNSANITVTRVGGSYGSVDVDYATSDGTATAGSDYTAVSGRLSFADGVTSQKFSIEILGDAIHEDTESLNLILSNPTGGAGLGSPSTASLRITDDDTQTDDGSTGGSSSGGIDLITLMLLFSFYLRRFRKNIYS